MKLNFRNAVLVLVAGLAFALGLASCSNGDDATVTPTPVTTVQTVRVISVTNGTPNAGENIAIANLQSFVNDNGGKLYSDLSCSKEVAVSSATAGNTYYVKVPTVTVVTVENGTANAGEKVVLKNLQTFVNNNGGKLYKAQTCAAADEIAVSGATADGTYYVKISTVTVIVVTNDVPAITGTKVQLAKLADHVNGVTDGDKKLYSDMTCKTEVAVASAEAGKTYYVKVTTTKVKIIIVTDGVAGTAEAVDVAENGVVSTATVGKKMQAYLLSKGVTEMKLFLDQTCVLPVNDISFAVPGNTYYAKIETTVTVIVVTNGTAAASGTSVKKTELQTYVNNVANGDKVLYADAACKTPIAVTSVTAKGTYYVKVTTSTSGGGSTTPTAASGNVYIVTYYLMNENDVSGKDKIAEAVIAKDKVSDYIKVRGGKLWAKDDRTQEVAPANAVAGNTYYCFFGDSVPKVKVWRVKVGTESTGKPEFIKIMNDDGFDNTWIAYLDKLLNERNVDTLYKWENNKKGAAVATSAVVENAEYCITYLPAEATKTYTFARDGKTYTITTDTEGKYSMKDGSTEVESGKCTQTAADVLFTRVESVLSTYGSMGPAGGLSGAELKVTYTIGANNVLTQKARVANYVMITRIAGGMEIQSVYKLFSEVQVFLAQLGSGVKLYEDKALTKEIAVSNIVAEKTYYANK